ncbi:MAG: FHA domain-containing protein, partial [Cyanobacteria bacterium Co-bin13]|nr:FHA domain-containing protein [Cyanobacteria bacterium Co-bin13]
DPLVQPEPLPFAAVEPDGQPDNLALDPFPVLDPQPAPSPAPPTPAPTVAPPPPAPGGAYSTTQLQVIQARLLHIQTNALLELPANVTVVRIGKPNDRVPPDIDVSGFPDSEIVSRSHAAIRVEGDVYYIEDVGSSNGTYVNNMPLPVGNRHRLRPGDRIALGKGDKVSFLFQVG